MVNKLKQGLRTGKACLNGWLAIPSGFSAEVMAQCGWDSVTVDLQHGVQDYLSMVQCFQAMQAHPVTPLVRVPVNEFGIINKALDAGASGVICPMVNNRQEAQSLVASCKYPPAGRRSNGPIRAAMYGAASNYQKTANDEVMVIPMIETEEALENLEAILDVPGIDAIYIGPSDLGFSLGLPPILDREESKILKIFEHIVNETTKRRIFAGLHTLSAAYSIRMIEMGFRFISIGNDSLWMARGAREAVQAVRGAAGELAEQ
ncbi:MAG: 2,4-dihydroxyhept-2-ene-1,7-dioic acid aldolase [Acetobacteraceae bacterium]|nr:2,4-dihydroxyhept-2-ene-1,7-dioic acid aldolase [Acetobacteraceae bacterium]